jgi:hypothetical protein
MTTFNKFDNTAEQRAAHYADNMERADRMIGSEVYIESVGRGLSFQINATLESNGDGYYYINNTVVRMDFRARDIELAMAMQSGNIIRINTDS